MGSSKKDKRDKKDKRKRKHKSQERSRSRSRERKHKKDRKHDRDEPESKRRRDDRDKHGDNETLYGHDASPPPRVKNESDIKQENEPVPTSKSAGQWIFFVLICDYVIILVLICD